MVATQRPARSVPPTGRRARVADSHEGGGLLLGAVTNGSGIPRAPRSKQLAANGDVFDMTAYTAVHRKLPLGSIVRVLNLENGKAVQVRINDRGPYVMGRMLDLSHAAAHALDMVESGITAVQIEVIGDHRAVAPIPPRELPGFAGIILSRESRSTSERRQSEEGVNRAAMITPAMSQQALYARRERRIGSMLAADHTAHNPVAALIIS